MPEYSFTKGPLRMLFSSICFAAMGYFAKLASAQLPGTEVALIRFVVGVLAALILAATGRISLRTSQKRLLITRGIFGGGAILLYFLAIAGGSLTNSTVLNNTFPIFATILAALFLKERLSPGTMVSMLIAWAGVGLLIHPDFRHLFWPDLLGLLSGVMGGFAITAVRELRRKNEPAWTIFFYLSLFGLIASLFFALPVWVWPNPFGWVYALSAALFGLIAQVSMTSAYGYCSSAVGGILSMSTMIFAAFIGIAFLGEQLSWNELGGAFLIAVGSIVVVGLRDKEPRLRDGETRLPEAEGKRS